MWQTAEWSIDNNSWSDNPFDIVAEVEFINGENGEVRRTKMFYAGNNTWKFRFTGTSMGAWTFTSSSSNASLSNHTGTVVVTRNPDNTARGFLTHAGNRYAVWQGNSPSLEPFRFMVFMNKLKFPSFDDELRHKHWSDSPLFLFKNPARLSAYLDNAEENGFGSIFLHPGFPQVWTDSGTPRLETFDLLEDIIRKTHARMMHVHIWMWGDAMRKATPKQFRETAHHGINGREDRRLQRYIAARLGPLPGWSMGYGFDLHEWTNTQQLGQWASFLHAESGWDHLLSARGFVLPGDNTINAYDGFGRNVPKKTSKYGPETFQAIVDDLDSDITRPHLYSERHTYKREHFKLDMRGTVRLVWRETMAGGMGGWFGFYRFSEHPYPHPERLRCARQFWNNYFHLDMVRNNTISNGHALASPQARLLVIYKEGTQSIQIQLPDPKKLQRMLCVDTQKVYEEIPLPLSRLRQGKLKLPYVSDWVVVMELEQAKT
jgi:hypothetical protein